MGAFSAAATLVLWWQAEALVALQFPRFAPETQALTVRLTRIMLPAQIFFISGGILRAALMAHGRFATQALAPLLLQRLRSSPAGLLLAPQLGAEGFAWGVLVGGFFGGFGAAWLDALRGLPAARALPLRAARPRGAALPRDRRPADARPLARGDRRVVRPLVRRAARRRAPSRISPTRAG